MSQPAPKSLFADRVFTSLWATAEFSFLGLFIHMVACAWMIATMTNSAPLVAMAQTANALPIVMFSMIAGALADIKGQRAMLIVALLLSIAASVALVVVAYLEVMHAWLLLGLLFLAGLGNALFIPAWQATLTGLVPRDRMADAVALHNIGANIMRTTGPSLGGFLIALVGPAVTFTVGALTYLPNLLVVLMWKPAAPALTGETESLGSAMRGGFQFLRASPQLHPVLWRAMVSTLTSVSVMALLPLIARDQMGGDATTYGFLFGAFGLGAILGGTTLQFMRNRFRNETIVRSAHLINVGSITLLAFSTQLWLGLIACIISGGCWLCFNSVHNSNLQLATPRWMAGRIVSMFFTGSFMGLVLGGWIWGLIAQLFGTEISLLVSAVSVLGAYILALACPLPETRNMIVDPLPQPNSPAHAPDQDHRRDPVQVMIEHRIDPDMQTEFHRLMFLRRRHMTRLGARNWTLMNALDKHDAWIETFQVASWADFERYLSRRTAESIELRAQVMAVQHDGRPPVITHYLTVTPGPKRHDTILFRV